MMMLLMDRILSSKVVFAVDSVQTFCSIRSSRSTYVHSPPRLFWRAFPRVDLPLHEGPNTKIALHMYDRPILNDLTKKPVKMVEEKSKLFRATQLEAKLRNEQITGQKNIDNAVLFVEQQVQKAVRTISGKKLSE